MGDTAGGGGGSKRSSGGGNALDMATGVENSMEALTAQESALRAEQSKAAREMFSAERLSPEQKAAEKRYAELTRKLDDVSAKRIALMRGEKPLSAAERATRNLESSRQNDIMEGGKRMGNLSGYKSNAPPAYKAPTKKQALSARQEADKAKSAWEYPKNPKVGDTVTNQYGTKLKWAGGYWRNLYAYEK